MPDPEQVPVPPKPGIYRNVPPELYHRWPAISSTLIKKVCIESPAHALAEKRKPPKDKDAFILGTGCHAACLEPRRYKELFAVGPDVKLNSTEGKTKWAAFEAANPGKKLIRGADGAKIEGMRAAVWAHWKISAILRAVTDIELSLVWVDEATGLLCKARPDIYCATLGLMPDFKTASELRKPGEREFYKFKDDALKFGYHIQLAMYRRGAIANGMNVLSQPIIAVENEDPFPAKIFQPSDLWMAAGESEFDRGMYEWKQCLETGVYPDNYDGDSVEEMDLTERQMKKIL